VIVPEPPAKTGNVLEHTSPELLKISVEKSTGDV